MLMIKNKKITLLSISFEIVEKKTSKMEGKQKLWIC